MINYGVNPISFLLIGILRYQNSATRRIAPKERKFKPAINKEIQMITFALTPI